MTPTVRALMLQGCWRGKCSGESQGSHPRQGFEWSKPFVDCHRTDFSYAQNSADDRVPSVPKILLFGSQLQAGRVPQRVRGPRPPSHRALGVDAPRMYRHWLSSIAEDSLCAFSSQVSICSFTYVPIPSCWSCMEPSRVACGSSISVWCYPHGAQ